MKIEPIGIMAAVIEEIDAIKARIIDPEEIIVGKAKFTKGTLNGVKVIVAILEKGWGKVDASGTATILAIKFDVKAIVFSGLAGAIDPSLNVGDIVISDSAMQHDFSAHPFFPKYHIPSAGKIHAMPDQLLKECAENATKTFLKQFNQVIDPKYIKQFKLKPKYVIGKIATGDQFISHPDQVAAIRSFEHTIHAVDMESAAILHIAERFEIPAIIIRIMSDNADLNSHIDFPAFNEHVGKIYSAELVTNLMSEIKKCSGLAEDL